MNNLIRFKLKMLIVLTFCVFMTFSMLIYVMKFTEKCEDSEDEMCFQVSKNPIIKATFLYYTRDHNNQTQITREVFRNSYTVPGHVALYKPTTKMDVINKTKKSRKDIVRLLSTYRLSLGNNVTSQSPLKYSISTKRLLYLINNHSLAVSMPVNIQKNRKRNTHKEVLGYHKFANSIRKMLLGQLNSSIDVYLERRRNLQQNCRRFYNSNEILRVKKIKFNHILIDEKNKILYCYVPKVACTNWKRIFLILTGKANNISEVINLPSNEVHAKNLFKSLQNRTIAEVQNITEEYTKFIFVRHPFERLLSAFRNKLEQHYDSSKYFQARFGKYIIKNFRKNPTNVSLAKGDDVTFAEFVNYVISSNPNKYNEHWQRVTDLCHPCLVNYDFIGKYESLIEDSNFLLKYLGYDISFPILSKPSTTASNLKKYFKTLDKSTIYKLYSIYEMDFKLFGYNLFNTSDWSNF